MIAWRNPNLIPRDSPFYLGGILASVLISTFLTILSAVATMIADSNIQGELALSDSQATWLTTLYLLGTNTSVPAGNWFADRFGYKTMYSIGLVLFMLASILVSVAVNFPMIGASRFIEGLGAGLIFPLGLAIIVQNVSSKQLPLALLLYISACFGAGFTIGLPFSGYLTQFFSWRLIFVFITAISFLSFILCALVQEDTEKVLDKKFDVFGYFSFILFVCLLLIGLTIAPLKSTSEGWRSPYVIGCFAISFLCLLNTIRIERAHPNPILPLRLFQNPIYALACLTMFLLGISLFASVSTSVIYMLKGLSYEKFVSGKIACIYGLVLTLVTFLSNLLIKKIPVAVLSFTGLILLTGSYFLNNILDWQTGPHQILLILTLRGIGLGLSLGPTTIQAMAHVPKELSNRAAVLLTFFRQVGATYGGTIISLITIKRTIFHTARFGEQSNTQLPAFINTSRKIFYHYSTTVSDKGQESKQQAVETIIRNIETQAFIQAINDAMMAMGSVTLVAALALVLLSFLEWRKKPSEG